VTAALERSSTSCANGEVVGSTLPRLFTPPLVEGPPGPCGCGCALSEATSYGFAVVEFADVVLGLPLDPWERWVAIHGGELLPDGRPRFRKLLIIVARQNGKTHMLVVLSLFWLFVDQVALVLGTSTNLDYARESWEKAVTLAEDNEVLAEGIHPRTGVRRANGEQTLSTVGRCRYKIAAANRRGGRSLTIHRLILDELREHHSFEAWSAAYNAMNAVRDGQCWAITNQGDDRSVVLDSLHSEAVDEQGRLRPPGEVDMRLGLFEYSAPVGSRPDDPAAIAMANPNLGRRIELDDLLADARRAMRNGGEELAQYLTEVLCIRVKQLDPVVDVDKFNAPAAEGGCLDPGSLDEARDRVALVFDVSLDGQHATLYAAAQLEDGRVRPDPVKAWDGLDCLAQLRRELPGLVERIRPRALGWYPNGPSAAVAADMAERKGWPPPGVKFEAIKSEATAVCMGFSEQIAAAAIAQSGDPLLIAQLQAATKVWYGDAWRFGRKGGGHVDAAYAAAGAVHLARTLPPPRRRPRLVVAGRDTSGGS
jgi:hypothetical protein